MGFFSWNCAVSGESIASRHAGRPKEESDCYLILPHMTIHEPRYEGYGVFGGLDIYEVLGNGDREQGIRYPNHIKIKIVKAKYFDNQTYAELPESEECDYQGYFYDESMD